MLDQHSINFFKSKIKLISQLPAREQAIIDYSIESMKFQLEKELQTKEDCFQALSDLSLANFNPKTRVEIEIAAFIINKIVSLTKESPQTEIIENPNLTGIFPLLET